MPPVSTRAAATSTNGPGMLDDTLARLLFALDLVARESLANVKVTW
jgi:hypothetical protein